MFYTVVQELQRKWKSLRNSFSREQAKRKNLKSGSGGSTWKTYVYYNQLSFLSSCAANKLTTSNLSSSHDSPDENENDIEEVNSDLNETTGEVLENVLRHKPAKKQKTVENEYENEFFNSVTKSLQERERRESVLSLLFYFNIIFTKVFIFYFILFQLFLYFIRVCFSFFLYKFKCYIYHFNSNKFQCYLLKYVLYLNYLYR